MAQSSKMELLVRLGYAARAIVYILFGWLALQAAGEAAGGTQGAFERLQEIPLGAALLWLCALGLVGYALFKFASAIGDVQHHGSDAKGVAKRIGDAGSGVAHTILAFAAYRFATGARQSASDGESGGQDAAGTVLSMPLGDLVVGLVGLGFIAAAIVQAKHAATGDFMQRVSPRAPSATEWLGRLGMAARAVVFAIIGWSLMRSAWFDSQSEVTGIGGALQSLRDDSTLYTFTAAGLLLFGVFSLVVARYQVIPDLGPDGFKPKFR